MQAMQVHLMSALPPETEEADSFALAINSVADDPSDYTQPAPLMASRVQTEIVEPKQDVASASVSAPEYFSRDQLSVSPRPLGQIQIPWPPAVLLLGKSSAIFTLFIDEAGRVDKMVADAHSLTPAMEEVALQTFKQARFSPGLKNGLPVKAILRIEVEFEATLVREEAPQLGPQIIERRNL